MNNVSLGKLLQRNPLMFVTGLLLACGTKANPDKPTLVSHKAPSFSAKDQGNTTRKLEDFRNQYVVLYFYPKDGTPGCTKEACAFRDAWDSYKEQHVAILGVSQDSVESHREFAEEHDIDFPLLADINGSITQKYNVASRIGMSSRVSFLIAPDGVILKRYDEVDPGVHANEILRDIEAFDGS